MANIGGGAEAHARFKQYEYRANSAQRQSKRRRLREESVLTTTEEGVYQPKTKETRAAYEAMLSVIQQQLGGQPLNIVSGAADEILSVLKNETLKNPDKKSEIEKMLNQIPNAVFDQLVSIGSLITDYQDAGGSAAANEDEGLDDDVAVEFEEKEDDDEESELDMVQEDDEDDGDVAERNGDEFQGANEGASLNVQDIDAYWLQRKISESYDKQIDPLQCQTLAEEVLKILSEGDDREVENKLLLHLQFDKSSLIKFLLRNRLKIVWCTQLARADNLEEKKKIEEEMIQFGPDLAAIVEQLRATRATAKERQKNLEKSIREEARRLLKDETASGDDDIGRRGLVNPESGGPGQRQILDLDSLAFEQGGLFSANKKTALPDESFTQRAKGYEEIHVLAPKPKLVGADEKLVGISSMPDWAQPAFEKMTSLNRVQSKVYETALFGAENLNINIGGPQGSDPILEDDGNELDIDSNDINNNRGELSRMNDEDHLLELNDCEQVLEIIENDPENGVSDGNDYPPPVAGMEFESYDDAYNYYNCYAKELGFAIRIKSSWTKRNSKEKRGAVLCCNCEGFKMIKEVSARRKETRTGCLAMIRLRLVESNRWRVDEVKLEHNHSFDPARANSSKSHKKMDSSGNKRKVEANLDVEVQTIKLYRTPVSNFGYGSSNSEERDTGIGLNSRLKLNKGDGEIIQNYFCRAQLKDPNFIYLMDFNDDGHLRNVLWMDSRSRASYTHFGDIVTFESRDYDVPFFAFVGINHHGKSILFGCGLIADETLESYIWLFRAWLTCMSGRPPQTIITNQSKIMQSVISEVFPRAHHRFSLAQTLFSSLGELSESQTFLERIIYDSLRVEEFETAWEDLMQQLDANDHELFRSLYETRERWAPVFMKDTFLAGISGFCRGNTVVASFFDDYIHQRTTLKEFFDTHEGIIEEKRLKESLDDTESQEQTPLLKTRSYYELQLSKIYTKSIFSKFQHEVLMMSNCFSSISQIQSNGSVSTYLIKEHDKEGDFEVMYDKSGHDIRCLCSCFNFNGYLCRHALCVLNCNGVEEIPFQYILARWRKDLKRVYVADFGPGCIDVTNPVQRFDHLYRKAINVVTEGVASRDHYEVAWQAFKESMNKVRLVVESEKHV